VCSNATRRDNAYFMAATEGFHAAVIAKVTVNLNLLSNFRLSWVLPVFGKLAARAISAPAEGQAFHGTMARLVISSCAMPPGIMKLAKRLVSIYECHLRPQIHWGAGEHCHGTS
jgi:hypothetical protein